MPRKEANSYVVRPVEKAISVLAYVAESGHLVSLKSVCAALAIPKTTAFRYLQTLTATGLLEHDAANDKYRIGRRLHLIAEADASINRARMLAHPIMVQLTDEFAGTVNLAVKGDGSIVYLDIIDTLGFRTKARIGDAHPLHSTALGKAILAFMPRNEAETYLSLPLTERTGRTLIEKDELERQLRQVARSGYAMEAGENEDGAMCVGVPILDEKGYPLAALSISAPLQKMSRHNAMLAGDRLLSVARDISVSLGQGPAGPDAVLPA